MLLLDHLRRLSTDIDIIVEPGTDIDDYIRKAGEIFPLSDFGTTGDKGVRMHDDYMQHYFVSEYDAIKDIDFTPIFEEIMNRESEAEQ